MFYNYILRCFVLCDLKTDELTHADLGQMQMYVNYYERELMNPGDNPPIGILLCNAVGKETAEYLAPFTDKQLFLSEYQLQLPAKEAFTAFLKKENEGLSPVVKKPAAKRKGRGK